MAAFMQINERNRKCYKNRREVDKTNFKALYRFTPENVDWVARNFLGGETGESRVGALTDCQKMRIFLRYIGDPGFQVGVGEDIGVHKTTACKTIWFFCCKIVTKAHDWIHFPCNETEMNVAKSLWRSNNLIPHTIGALYCTHVSIIRPHNHGDEFVNRKGQISFNIQATCEAIGRFTSVDCSWPGSVHDSRIWRNSSIASNMTENTACAILLADDGYGIAPWLMTPYRNPDTYNRKFYNKIHTKERVKIECAFGQVKKRFPTLQSKIRMQTRQVPLMVLACFILYNVAKFLKDDDFCLDAEIGREAYNVKERGQRRRDAIALHLRG